MVGLLVALWLGAGGPWGGALVGRVLAIAAASALVVALASPVDAGGALVEGGLFAAVVVAAAGRRRGRWARAPRSGTVIAAALFAVLVDAVLLAGVVAWALGRGPDVQDLAHIRAAASLAHPLGTDELGRDVLVRVLHGGRVSLAVGVIAALTSSVVGGALGLAAAWRGGLVDRAIMRTTDAALAIPVLPLMLLLASVDPARVTSALAADTVLPLAAVVVAAAALVVGSGALARHRVLVDVAIILGLAAAAAVVVIGAAPLLASTGTWSAIARVGFVIALFGWMPAARVVRGVVLPLRAAPFVLAARALGASDLRIGLTHLLPHALPALVVVAALEVASSILVEAALSFLGLGVRPPVPSWGNMLVHALDELRTAPSLVVWPGLLIFTGVACFQVLGDGMRDALDPRSSRSEGT